MASWAMRKAAVAISGGSSCPLPSASSSTATPAGADEPKRYLVPAECVHAENGHCYIVPLGPHYPGDGIKDGPASTLRLFEDGKDLGPAHAPHVEIREKGGGRYSHWVTQLYFSASDNTDPRANGRRYTWKLAP